MRIGDGQTASRISRTRLSERRRVSADSHAHPDETNFASVMRTQIYSEQTSGGR
jgi:hypothetical protein